MNENPDPLWDAELKHALHRNAEWGFLSESRPDTDGMYMPEFGPAPPHEHASLIAIKPVMEEKKTLTLLSKSRGRASYATPALLQKCINQTVRNEVVDRFLRTKRKAH